MLYGRTCQQGRRSHGHGRKSAEKSVERRAARARRGGIVDRRACRRAGDAGRRVAGDGPQAKSVSIDMAGVREFDTFGAWLLERLTRAWTSAGASR